MQYRSEIDGLRAVAVIPVILYHAGFETFRGGYVGVDVFFVISGYLITSIILSQMDEGRFSLVNFYERRARRILPALFFVMAVCIPFAWMWLLPRDMKEFGESLVAVATFSSNILFWHESGYFDIAAELKPLLHTWSLAVEEQYYILFPPFLMLMWKFGKRWMLAILVAAALLSLGLAQWGAYNLPSATFYLLPTRGWEILLGSFIAFYFNRFPSAGFSDAGNQLLSLAGLVMIALATFTFSKQTPFPSLYALVPTLGTVLVILFTRPGTVVFRLFSNRIMVGIGLISYSAYLWHYPVLAFARQKYVLESSYGFMALAAASSLLLGFLSWKYVEKPFRYSKNVRMVHSFLLPAGVFLVVFFVNFGLFGSISDGYLKARITGERQKNYSILAKSTQYDFDSSMIYNGDCHFWNNAVNDKIVKKFDQCVSKYGKAIVILGDSHAMNLYNIVAKADFYPFVMGISKGGCRPQYNAPRCHYNAFDRFLDAHKQHIKYIMFHQSGSYFVADKNNRVDSQLAFMKDEVSFVRGDYIKAAAAYVAKLNKQVKTYWVGPFVEARVRDSELAEMAFQDKFRMNPKSIFIFRKLESYIAGIISREKYRFKYISLNRWMGLKGGFLRVGDCITYRDVDHFSRCGEDLLARFLRKKLAGL